MAVEMLITYGKWSEGVMSRALAVVLGYEVSQEGEVNTQSSFSSKGEGCCMLDQVYFLPWSTISLMPNELMASLNLSMLFVSPSGLFLSASLLMRLKSPVIIWASELSM